MTAQWNSGIPALVNQVVNDYPDVEENFGWVKLLLQMNIGWKDSTIANVGPSIVTRRPKFAWTDGNTITIGPGGYFHEGTTRQWVFWDATITFEAFRPGTGGSNASNAAASASAWHYIYIDDSAVVTNASPELVAACFLNSTTAPTWSDVGHGWYTGADRCIFAVLTDGSNNIIEFRHDGGEYVLWADQKTEASDAVPSNAFQDVDCASSIPGFSTKGKFTVSYEYVDQSTGCFARVNGQTGSTGHSVAWVGGTGYGTQLQQNTFDMMMDTSQIFEIKTGSASNNKITVYTNGWYFPVGM